MASLSNNCLSCASYNREERRCSVGKANPRRKLDAVAVAETLGLHALCIFCEHREELVRHAHKLGPVLPVFRPKSAACAIEVDFLEADQP
jgi:hypothetical protein